MDWIDPNVFVAADYNLRFDDPHITSEDILADLSVDAIDKIQSIKERLATVTQTVDRFKTQHGYLPARSALHRRIINEVLSPERTRQATPESGLPTYTVLGGRGGSGKSWFKGKLYDPSKTIVLDADEVKAALPEYHGWNANEVHEESSDVVNLMDQVARSLRLNVVHDITMRTPRKVLELVQHFKNIEYQVDAFYMYLPRQIAAKRVIARYFGPVGRYVPVEVILENKFNEFSFDGVRSLADNWGFWNNNVPLGTDPTLISEKR